MSRLTLFPILLLFSVAATAVEETPVSKNLEPMEKWVLEVGYVWEGVNNDGESVKYELISMDDGEPTWRTESGCIYTRPETFAPSTKWSNCGGRSGSQNIYETEGSPWPLREGKKFSYKFTGIGNGRSWRATQECEVMDQVRVKVPAGEYDTYKVSCKDKWNERTWWVAPELETVVASKRRHFRDKARRGTEMLVKRTRPK